MFGPELASKILPLKTKAIASNNIQTIEIALGPDRVYEFAMEIQTSSLGKSLLLTTITDLSEERGREKLLHSLLKEVNHRSRNLLAIVQSMANQTARSTDGIEEFLTKFRGRLQSLAHSQDMVTDSSWKGAKIHQLIDKQCEIHLLENSRVISVNGPDLELNPNSATHIGLAIHELIVNAVHRGSLDLQDANIEITIEAIDISGKPNMRFEWCEAINDQDGKLTEFHMANKSSLVGDIETSDLLSHVVPQSVGGTISFHYENSQLTYIIEFPI